MIDKLHYISQSTANSPHLESIEKVLAAGGKWIQLRVKHQPENSVLVLAKAAVKLCRQYNARLIINDYPMIALKAGADGVHLGLEDMPVATARALLGPDRIIGGTANTFEHILLRVAEGADYIGLGPYRFTTTKQNLSPLIGLQGYLSLMEQVKIARITIPIIAIGGIEHEDISLLMETGLHGVAISGALTNKANTDVLLNKFYSELETDYVKNSR